MARHLIRTTAVAVLTTLVIGLAPPTADGETAAALPPCADTPSPARVEPPPRSTPTKATPSACRARHTRIEPARNGALPVPEPGYHHLGGTTTGEWAGVLGRLGVRTTGVRQDSFDFVATRFMAKRGTRDGDTTWLEVGWADTGWSGDDQPRIYTFDSHAMSWVFYDQYRLRDGDRIWVYLQSEGATWQAWLWWEQRWHLLTSAPLDIGARARIEQYVEIHLDEAAGTGTIPVPPVPVDGVHLRARPDAAPQLWRGHVPTVVLGDSAGYCLSWHREFHDWSAGDCAD